MEIKSKIHWMSVVLFPSLLFFGIVCLILIARLNFVREDKLPFGGLVFVWLLVSLMISLGFFSIYSFKKLILNEDNITVKHVILKTEHTYKYEQISGYSLFEGYDSSGKYKNCSFKTLDNKTYMFSSREFRNYDELANLISEKCHIADVSFYSNVKSLFVFFLIFGSISASILYLSVII